MHRQTVVGQFTLLLLSVQLFAARIVLEAALT